VRFIYVFGPGLEYYVVREKFFHGVHGSGCGASNAVINGRVLIRSEAHLREAEHAFLMTLGTSLGASRIRTLMRQFWPTHEYDGDLLQRMIRKAKNNAYGGDAHAMNAFIAACNDERTRGGVVDLQFGQDMRLTGIVFQPSCMVKYAQVCGDVTQIDGTFTINMYDQTMVVASNIDGLGKSTITAFFLAPSENSAIATRGMRLCGLARPGCVLMSDGAAAFSTTAANLGMVHILCTKHYVDTAMKAHGGMVASVRDDFLRDAYSLIFDPCPLDKFAQFYDEVRATYSQYDNACRWLDLLAENKSKVRS
jgi:hypothetical protein